MKEPITDDQVSRIISFACGVDAPTWGPGAANLIESLQAKVAEQDREIAYLTKSVDVWTDYYMTACRHVAETNAKIANVTSYAEHLRKTNDDTTAQYYGNRIVAELNSIPTALADTKKSI